MQANIAGVSTAPKITKWWRVIKNRVTNFSRVTKTIHVWRGENQQVLSHALPRLRREEGGCQNWIGFSLDVNILLRFEWTRQERIAVAIFLNIYFIFLIFSLFSQFCLRFIPKNDHFRIFVFLFFSIFPSLFLIFLFLLHSLFVFFSHILSLFLMSSFYFSTAFFFFFLFLSTFSFCFLFILFVLFLLLYLFSFVHSCSSLCLLLLLLLFAVLSFLLYLFFSSFFFNIIHI